MRILVINYEFPPVGGGGGEFTKNLASHLDRLGIEIDILSANFDGLPSEVQISENTRLMRTGLTRENASHATKVDLTSFVLSSMKWVSSNNTKYDLVHSHFAIPSGLPGYLAQMKKRIPHLISLLGADVYDPTEYYNFLRILSPVLKSLYNSADHLVSPSQELKNRCISSGCVKPISVIPHGIDLKKYDPGPYSSRSETDNTIVCICRLVKRKALEYQIRAIPTVIDAVPDAQFIFIGDGPEREKLIELSNELKIQNSVTFTGYVSREKLIEIIDSSKIFAMHTLHEAFGIVFLEAMALGKPIVSTNVGAVPEVVTEDVGILVNPKDPEAFANAVVTLIENDEKRSEMAERSLNRVKDYSWEVIAQKYLQLYNKLIIDK